MINVNTDIKNPAILFSGGVDSTLVYLLYAKQKMNIPLYIIDRHNNPIVRAKSLHDKIFKFYGYKFPLNVMTIPEMESYKQMKYISYELLKTYDTIIYSVNKYPDDEEIRPKYAQSMVDVKRLRQETFLEIPLIEYDKSQIIQSYYDNDWQDILEFTHSCGNNSEVPCGNCFNCKERIWAYKKLSISLNLGI